MQGIGLGFYAFAFCNVSKVVGDVFDLDAVEIEYLATREDGRNYFMFLCSCKNKDGVPGRLFQRFKESIEGRLREHVHLIDDVYFMRAELRGETYLADEVADIFHRVIGSGIEFVDVKRMPFVKRLAGLTFITRFDIGSDIEAVNGFSEYACAGGFAHPARTTEQKGLGQVLALDGVL